MTRIPLPHAGDIVLTRTSGKLSTANRAAQTVATLSGSRFTHVLLFVAPGCLIESTPESGVQLLNLVKAINAGRLTTTMCETDCLRVLRAKALAETNEDESALQNLLWTAFSGASSQLKKKYNHLFLVPNASDRPSQEAESNRAFCSELAALILKPLNILPESFSRPSTVLPTHFEQLSRDQGWEDVTSEIRALIEHIERRTKSQDHKLAETFQETIDLIKSNRELTESAKKFNEIAREIEGFFSGHK